MSTDSKACSGGGFQGWAVWPDEMPKAHSWKEPAQRTRPQGRLEAASAHEIDVLKAKYELLTRENELLRHRLEIADRQVEVKDSQINDFKALSESLSRQNQVLLMLAQGVPIERIINAAPRDMETFVAEPGSHGQDCVQPKPGAQTMDAARSSVLSRIAEHAKSGMTYRRIAVLLNEEGVQTFSMKGVWNRGRVDKAMRLHRKTYLDTQQGEMD